MQHPGLLCALCAAAIPALVNADNAAIQGSAFRAGRWDGRAYESRDGAFSHCAVVSSQPKSTLLFLSETVDGALYVGVRHVPWKLPIGKTYRVSLVLDGVRWEPQDATTIAPDALRIGPMTSNQMAMIRVGRELGLKAERDYLLTSLEDVRLATNALAQCVARFQAVAPPGSGVPETVPLKSVHGTFVVPVLINGQITLDFTVDSGAADVSIPADVFSTLVRTGTIRTADYMDTREYELADGTKTRSRRFLIRSLRVGGVELQGVAASVAPTDGVLLLGESFLSRLGTWAIDNRRHLLVINQGAPAGEAAGQPQTHGTEGTQASKGDVATEPWYDCMKRLRWREGANAECSGASDPNKPSGVSDPNALPGIHQSPAKSSPSTELWYDCMKQHQWRDDARDACSRASAQ